MLNCVVIFLHSKKHSLLVRCDCMYRLVLYHFVGFMIILYGGVSAVYKGMKCFESEA